MYNNTGYYNKLLQYSKTIPCPSEKQIILDLRRTFPEEKDCMTDSFLEKLKNVLICYSIRNTSVGYCQGMNFIGGRLLLIMGNEEQTFWLFVQIMEKILSIIYYSELVGIVVETTIIENLISFYFPKLQEYFIDNNFNVPLRNFIHKWMVGLFTQTLSPEMVYTFFDFLFLDGRDLLIKNSLFIISFIHDKLIKNNNIEFMYSVFNEGLLKIHDPKTMIYFLEQNFLKNIDSYRKKLEKSIITKVKEEASLPPNKEKKKNRMESLKEKGIICNPNWPTCIYDDYTENLIDVLILKENKLPYVINDYYYIKNDNYPDNKLYEIYKNKQEPLSPIKEVLIERHKHICDNAKLVDSSKMLIDEEYKKIDIDIINLDKNNDIENKIYDKLKKSEDFDNAIKEIQIEMKKTIKPFKINDINIIINNNEKGEKYYSSEYFYDNLE
jgi:hypothetical protein